MNLYNLFKYLEKREGKDFPFKLNIILYYKNKSLISNHTHLNILDKSFNFLKNTIGDDLNKLQKFEVDEDDFGFIYGKSKNELLLSFFDDKNYIDLNNVYQKFNYHIEMDLIKIGINRYDIVEMLIQEYLVNILQMKGNAIDITSFNLFLPNDVKLKRVDNINEKVEYKEIEFVCHNSDYKNSTDKKSQKELYKDLKKLEIQSGYNIKPYMQDFSSNNHEELSLAVIILDKDNENYWKEKILNLATKYDIKVDLFNNRSNKEVDSIIKGDYYDNIV